MDRSGSSSSNGARAASSRGSGVLPPDGRWAPRSCLIAESVNGAPRHLLVRPAWTHSQASVLASTHRDPGRVNRPCLARDWRRSPTTAARAPIWEASKAAGVSRPGPAVVVRSPASRRSRAHGGLPYDRNGLWWSRGSRPRMTSSSSRGSGGASRARACCWTSDSGSGQGAGSLLKGGAVAPRVVTHRPPPPCWPSWAWRFYTRRRRAHGVMGALIAWVASQAPTAWPRPASWSSTMKRRSGTSGAISSGGRGIRSTEPAMAPMGSGCSWLSPHDLVLTDLRMAGIDGWAIADEVRRSATAPVILITGADSEEDRRRAEARGLVLLQKPVDLRHLTSLVTQVLSRAGSPTHHSAPHSSLAGARSRTMAEPARPLVFVVEDEPDVRELVREALEGEGYRTQALESGEAALKLAPTERAAAPGDQLARPRRRHRRQPAPGEAGDRAHPDRLHHRGRGADARDTQSRARGGLPQEALHGGPAPLGREPGQEGVLTPSDHGANRLAPNAPPPAQHALPAARAEPVQHPASPARRALARAERKSTQRPADPRRVGRRPA